MHNYKLKRTNKVIQFKPGGSFFSKLFSNSNMTSLFKGLGSSLKGGTNSMPTGMGADVGGQNPETEAEGMGNVLGNLTGSALNGFLSFSNINNSGMNKTQKGMAKADAAVDTISSLASNIPGLGGVIGGSLGAINKIGGALIKTPKNIKNYITNDDVATSSGFTGVGANAGEVSNSIDTYKSSGLMGKLFGTKTLKNDVNLSNNMQTQVAKELDFNKFAKARVTSSSDLFSTNTKNKNYNGDMWTTRAVQFGQNGTKLQNSGNVYKSPVDNYITTDENLKAYNKTDLKWNSVKDLGQWYDGFAKPAVNYDTQVRFPFGPSTLKQSMTNEEWKHIKDSMNLNDSLTKGIKIDPNNPVAQYNTIITDNLDKVRKLLKQVREQKLTTQNTQQSAPSEKETTIFKEGGKVNVIVNGALHAHKHKLKEIEKFKDTEMTNKGVPVIIEHSEGGIVQQAEVEVGELILHKELTSKMEDLAKENSDEAMIQAGRILAKEIVKNTKDKTGILKTA